ncbi:MAG: hypothetical protein AB8B87_01695 [Granulosicoccus sp.]
METQNGETPVEQTETSVDENVSLNRRKTLTKLAYGSPAIATLFLSKSAAAQASFPPFPNPPTFP